MNRLSPVPIKNPLEIIGRLFLLAKSNTTYTLIGLVLVSAVLGALEALGALSIMPFVSLISDSSLVTTNQNYKSAYEWFDDTTGLSFRGFLVASGLLSVIVIFISAAYKTFAQYYINKKIENLRSSISATLLETYLSKEYEFFSNTDSADLSKNILSEVDNLVVTVLRPVFNMFGQAPILVAMIILVFWVDSLLAVALVFIFGFFYVVVYFAARQRLSLIGAKLVISNRERFKNINEVFGGIKQIKLSGGQEAYLKYFEYAANDYASSQASMITWKQAPNFIVEAAVFGSLILVCIFLVVMSGDQSADTSASSMLPTLGLFAIAAYRMKPAVQTIYQGIVALRYGRPMLLNIFSQINAPVAQKVDVDDITNKANLSNLGHDLVLRDLTFCYKGAKSPILKNINLRVSEGKKIAIIGSTGTGKSSLIDLMTGLLSPTSGAVVLGGIDLAVHNPVQFSSLFGYVPQDIYLINSSIAENIAFPSLGIDIDMSRVEECAKIAEMHHFIVSDLSLGYQHVIGDRGVRLSGGQRQRIGIARALYRRPKILILDEATSALDIHTETRVIENVISLGSHVSIVMVAHRHSTIAQADEVYVLKGGKVAYSGTPSKAIEFYASFS
jgi:ABC-type bacteriocin/lantibiotic exporter with double-glycine peptidase domain